MQVTVYGAGYVGLVSAVCLAELGHEVYCVDVDQAKIDLLNRGQLPIYEKGLASLLKKNLEADRIHFTSDTLAGVSFGAVQIIAVGTPEQDDGSVNMRYVFEVAGSIGEHVKEPCVVVTKSTVPVGTAERVHTIIFEALAKRELQLDVETVSNPEFLKEGDAVSDFMNPDRIIVGTENKRVLALMRELYAPLIAKNKPFMVMDLRSAELTKYVANAFLATKISFMNEMSGFAERLDADIEQIKLGLGLDKRISDRFLNPGCGFGGSCFPKDVNALQTFSQQLGYRAHITEAVLKTNEAQKRVLFEKVYRFFNGELAGKTIALWGLSFKPNTDDIRSAPSLALMELFWKAGAKVQAHDPMAMPQVEKLYGVSERLLLCETPEAALKNADVLVVATEWEVFQCPDFDMIKRALTQPAIFDGRNLYDPEAMARLGFYYFAIGRGLDKASIKAVKDADEYTTV